MGKKGHIYLIVRKKGGRLIGKENQAAYKKIFNVSNSFLIGTVKKINFQ